MKITVSKNGPSGRAQTHQIRLGIGLGTALAIISFKTLFFLPFPYHIEVDEHINVKLLGLYIAGNA